ncbi:hypothetical protein BDN67DRAFT_971774 [Paxillus ammoniavirescens]|nr:hypothetical protein BDN67DRAFT_971774 [Paxillus ammoniavirescens]
MVLFINVRGGFTACLKEAALAGRKVIVLLATVPVTTESLPRLKDHLEKTGDDSNSDIIEEDGKAKAKNKDVLHAMEAVKIESGRPNLQAILREGVLCLALKGYIASPLCSARTSVPGVQSSDKRRPGRP